MVGYACDSNTREPMAEGLLELLWEYPASHSCRVRPYLKRRGSGDNHLPEGSVYWSASSPRNPRVTPRDDGRAGRRRLDCPAPTSSLESQASIQIRQKLSLSIPSGLRYGFLQFLQGLQCGLLLGVMASRGQQHKAFAFDKLSYCV